MTMKKPIGNIHSQSGAALAISLIILLVLTLVVVSSTQNGVVQERMASAVRDSHVSLEDAEIALAAAQAAIFATSDSAAFIGSTGTNGLYDENLGPTDFFDPNNWQNTNSVLVSSAAGTDTRYFIEHLGLAPVAGGGDGIELTGRYGAEDEEGEVEAFRIVVRATGESGKAERVLVSYFGMLY